MRESELLHTLDTEAYEAALEAAKQSLRSSDLRTLKRLESLADSDSGDVVSEAAEQVLSDPLVSLDRRGQ